MKKLVVYYSYTGNTERMAKKIAGELNCDILRLTPKTPFSTDYDRVVREYQNNSINDKPVEINDIGVNLADYDEIIIGTPIWWYTLSPVVTAFMKKYDLSGKKVSLFATNAGWLGHTFKDFEKLRNSCEIIKEMNLVFDVANRSKLKTDEKEFEKWIKTL